MFTGIVEEMGKIRCIEALDSDWIMVIEASLVLEGTRLGDSIAVNGTCLTVTHLDEDSFQVGVAPETRKRTNLATLQPGDPVNLERAVTAATRLGGHLVQGHVDGLGLVLDIHSDGEALWFWIGASSEIMRYLVPKGFICLDGASLTVVEVEETRFSIMLVNYTQGKIVMAKQDKGYRVNIEVDVVGKYVEKFAQPYLKNLSLGLPSHTNSSN